MTAGVADATRDVRGNDSPAVAECTGVSRTFGRGRGAVVALHDVSCSIPTGAQVALVGPSGSGKSTLLHILAGLDAPSGGSVRWPALAGAPLRPGPVAVVFQAPSLVPALSVTENVALPLLLAGTRARDAHVAAHHALHTVGLATIGDKLPDELSGGQAQRVAIARARAGRPQLLLADEPTGQLDVETAGVVVDALLTTARLTGAALVIATHDPAVWSRCATVWRIVDGALLAMAASR